MQREREGRSEVQLQERLDFASGEVSGQTSRRKGLAVCPNGPALVTSAMLSHLPRATLRKPGLSAGVVDPAGSSEAVSQLRFPQQMV